MVSNSTDTGAPSQQELSKQLILISVYCFISTFGTLANGMILLVYILSRRLRTDMSTYFLISLSFADFLIAVLVVPLLIGGTFTPDVVPTFLVCATILLLATVTNVCAITWDRYYKIFHPLHYPQMMTNKRIWLILVSVWLIPVPLGSLPYVLQNIYSRDDKSYKITLALLDSLFVLFSFLLCYAYYLILKEAEKHSQQIARQKLSVNPSNSQSFSELEQSASARKSSLTKRRSTAGTVLNLRVMRENKAVKFCAIIVISFVLLWFPTVSYDLCVLAGLSDHLADSLTIVIALMNIVVDPLVYSLYKQDFKLALKKIISKRCPCSCVKTHSCLNIDEKG